MAYYFGDGDCGKIVLFACISYIGPRFIFYDLKMKAMGKFNSCGMPYYGVTITCLKSLVTLDGWKKWTAEAQEEDG